MQAPSESNLQAIADRVEIEALRGEFADAAMMCDYDRIASLFTPDGALRMPDIPAELVGPEKIRAWGAWRPAEYLVQTTHPGIQLDGDTAFGRGCRRRSRMAAPTSTSSGAPATAGRS